MAGQILEALRPATWRGPWHASDEKRYLPVEQPTQPSSQPANLLSGRGQPAPALVKIALIWQTSCDIFSSFPVACLMLADPANVLRLADTYRQFAEQEAAGRSP